MASKRRVHDFYETPPHYVDALQRVIGIPQGRLIEPCTGKGAIIDMLKVDGVWHTNDVNKKRNTMSHLNAASNLAWRAMSRMWWEGAHTNFALPFAWGITNPPFNRRLMLPIVRNMLRWCDNVAVLARLSFLEPTIDRAPFWSRWARTCEVIVLPRYSFKRVGGKRTTDSVTCAWLVWRKARTVRQLYVSSLQEKKG